MRSLILFAASILVALSLGLPVQAEESAALPIASNAAPTARLKLDAVVAYGAAPIAEAVNWKVIRPASNAGPEQVLLTETSVSPQFDMAPGNYIVEATHASLTVRQDVIVPQGNSKQTINFNAGFVTMSMITHTGASPIATPILWEVYEYRKGGITPDALITSASAAAQAFTLPAGAYVVRATYNGTTADLIVPLDPGRTYSYMINLYAGTIGIDAVAEGGGSLDGVVYEIYKAALDQNGERPLVATYNAVASNILLREGSYLLIAKGAGMQGQTAFQVEAAQDGMVKVVLKPGSNG